VIRQPCRGATIAAIDEAALRRAASGPFELLRDGEFLAVIAADESIAEALAEAACGHVTWDGVETLHPSQEEARWLLQRPSIDRLIGPDPEPGPPGVATVEATFSRAPT
jgi:hypothetical protein